MNFEASYTGSRTHIQNLAKNHIHKLKKHSALAELLRFFKEPHEDHMSAVIEQQSSNM